MKSELDAVIEAMVNRDRETADEVRTGKRAGEWRGPSVAPLIPRPKGARVKFVPSLPVSIAETRSTTSVE